MRVLGIHLTAEQQKQVLSSYTYRYTGDNKPSWANAEWKNGQPYPLQFKDDQDWLANTDFNVTQKGKLSLTDTDCYSRQTWPNNPELRKG
jgi:hypothetical protein